MKIDPALTLKKDFDQGKNISIKKVKKILNESELINKLLAEPKQKPRTFVGLRAYEWRLLELSEIPYTYTLNKVKRWLNMLIEKSYIKEGFSLTGDKDGLLSCHNSMITSILMKMNYDDKDLIDAGISWIIKYQSTSRGEECRWTGKNLFTKYGGCMKKTPCFYGVVKSMITLTEYKKRFDVSKEVQNKLNQGLEYILDHKVYKKLSTGEPIESSIIKNFYPYTYRSNIIEILSLLKANDLLDDERCNDAMDVLRQKRRDDGFWQADTSYMKTAWVDFDKPQKPGQWVSYVIKDILNE
ncbi:hypothetical protein GM661_07890 [Iocasia frigidifontis]|uniref:Uncharacterized protein n=1 Tax=Iocasia fonsfrigidae TaxID=2682810 RepID=A0A8A7KE42_9FIRM|nr:hypothetical protein [Iocasia fonsfrigidae]QTL97908.1 hypothetical protein GM661_07890 [Iocasia fonsfrigidae]